MKVAIYDSKNTKRHLGDIEYTAYDHHVFKVVVLTTSTTNNISPTVTERTTIERKVFVTDLPLSTLLKLQKFTLPNETTRVATWRRNSSNKSRGNPWYASTSVYARYNDY